MAVWRRDPSDMDAAFGMFVLPRYGSLRSQKLHGRGPEVQGVRDVSIRAPKVPRPTYAPQQGFAFRSASGKRRANESSFLKWVWV